MSNKKCIIIKIIIYTTVQIFEVIMIFFEDINTFIEQGHIKSIECDSKRVIILQDVYFNYIMFFWTLYYQRIL